MQWAGQEGVVGGEGRKIVLDEKATARNTYTSNYRVWVLTLGEMFPMYRLVVRGFPVSCDPVCVSYS